MNDPSQPRLVEASRPETAGRKLRTAIIERPVLLEYWNIARRYKWSKGLPLWHIIAENSFRHEAEHMPDIRAFARRWQAQASG